MLGREITIRRDAGIDVLAHQRFPPGTRAGRNVDKKMIGAGEHAQIGDDAPLRIERGGVLPMSRR